MMDPPKHDTLEVNLFGGGSAYGESILCHIGNDDWVVVDSFKDPNSDRSIISHYLESIGKDLSKIKLIVATHWHDDHINGLSQIYL